MKLTKSKSFTIIPTSPFSFDSTIHKPSHFPSNLEDYQKGMYWQTIRIDGIVYGLKLENQGTVNKPKIKAIVYSNKNIADSVANRIKEEINYRYDLQSDYLAFYAKFANDKILKPVIKKYLGTRVKSSGSLYEFLIITILLQNTTVKRTVQMMGNLLNEYGVEVEFDGKKIMAIWTPTEMLKVPEQELRDLKVGYREKSIKRLSEDFANKIIDEKELRKLPKEDCKKELLKLYGVGKQSVWYLLFECFHHYDAFDTISPWEQKIYSKLLFNKTDISSDKILDEVKKRWNGWRMLASHLIFEDIFWKNKQEKISWLEKEIRL
jgi:3-methyladenine DNA glycosylase/8-oxoguanine DNA glycosylase